MDTLLDFLKENICLWKVSITIKFKHPHHHYSQAQAPIHLMKLDILSVFCEDPKDAEELVTYLPFQNKHGQLFISFSTQCMKLKEILSFSKHIVTSPVEMSMYPNKAAPSICLSSPRRSVCIYPVSDSEMASVLKGETRISFENMTKLSLNQPCLLPVNLASCKFPVLKSLTIEDVAGIPTLFKQFLPQDLPLLDTLHIYTWIVSKNPSAFIKALKRFASSKGMVLNHAQICLGRKVGASFEIGRAS